LSMPSTRRESRRRSTDGAARGADGVNTGQIISGAGHLAVIGWALFGGAFRSDPPPLEVVEATAISAEDYAALLAAQSAPEAVANVNTPNINSQSSASSKIGSRRFPLAIT